MVLVGAAHLATHELECLPRPVRIAFILSIIAIGLGGCVHLGYVHSRLTQERQQRQHLDRILGFGTVGA